IVGCGKIADAHVEQIRATGRGEVVAVADAEPLMAEQLAVRVKVPARYASLTAMLAESPLDVVHIATPPRPHLALPLEAIDAGCHVFVEKPFAMNADEARTIVERAREKSRHVSVNYLYNYEPPGLELQSMLDRGELGEIVHLDTVYGYNLGGDYGVALMSDPG